MANTERKITIAGNEFTIPQPFDAGHTLTEGEAKALNQTFAEAVRNNMAGKVKKGEAGQAEVSSYANNFQFTIATASTAARFTPEEREARNLAKAAIKAQLEKQGRKLTDADPEKLEAKIAEIASRDDIMKRATKIVADRKKVVLEDEELDLGVSDETEAGDETEEAPAAV